LPFFTLQLTAGGPIINAFVGVSGARLQALQTAGQAPPPLVPIRLLVDTGASNTCIDPGPLTQLGLTPTGVVSVMTASSGNQPHSCEQYDVSLYVPGALATHAPLLVANLAVMRSDLLMSQGIHGLLGRDVLSRCLMAYNGVSGTFTIAY
jgi:hypothetical protein